MLFKISMWLIFFGGSALILVVLKIVQVSLLFSERKGVFRLSCFGSFLVGFSSFSVALMCADGDDECTVLS